MAGAALQLMEVDGFLRWCLDQENRWELVDGVPLEMMAGASNVHHRITSNVIRLLGNQLRGSPCWPATGDTALRTRIRSLRRADVLVTCDPPRSDAYETQTPRMVVEVLSPSNKGISWARKLGEYRGHKGLDYVLLIESETVGVTLAQRDDSGGWDDVDADRFTETIELPRIGCRLSLSEIYEGTGLTEPVGSQRPETA